MENPDQHADGGGAPQARFVPDRRYTAAAAGGAVLAAAAAALTTDPPGRVLAGLAALLLAAYALSDLIFSPRLVVSAGGLVVHAPLARARLAWADVERVRADVRLRHGLRSTTLEIDAGALLVVLSRRALGAEPEDVAALVNAFRPR